MQTVVGVRFKRAGKIYYFSPGKLDIKLNDNVIVETARGLEFGTAVIGPREVPDGDVVLPLKVVQRLATDADKAKVEDNAQRRDEAFRLCEEKIAAHGLPMKLVDVEYTFDVNKIICHSFLGEFDPVSIRMAKEQNLSLNPTKISGICGRLMCCLKYESNCYNGKCNKRKKIKPPVQGSKVITAEGEGKVINLNMQRRSATILLDDRKTIVASWEDVIEKDSEDMQ